MLTSQIKMYIIPVVLSCFQHIGKKKKKKQDILL